MSATTKIFYKPTSSVFTTRSPKLKSFKPNSSVGFPCKKSHFCGGFATRTMTQTVKLSAFKGDRRNSSCNVEEDVGVFEQEALINGSSQLVAGGLESTLNNLSKWIVFGSFGAVIIWRHDAQALWAAMGSVANTILSLFLKRILNEERPVSTLRSDPGMPSSHAQSIFFIVTFATVSMMKRLGINVVTLAISGLTLAFGSYLSWLRVSQQFHTKNQVIVGAILGFIFSILWSLSWDAFVLEAYISSLWVRVVVILGAFVYFLTFLLYSINCLLRDER